MKNRLYIFLALGTLLTACEKYDDGKGSETDPTDHTRPVTEKSSKWISKIVEFRPAPGQFVNKNPGNMESAQGLVGKKGMVSLGGWGGYVVFQFDHTVQNQTGYDFVIHGNAFTTSNEPGIVMVSVDVNGNGLADDPWYELAGEDYALESTIKNYSITYQRPSDEVNATDVAWTDNKGGSGVVAKNGFHKQCYYPLFLSDNPASLTFTGTRLRDLATESGGMWTPAAAGKGYADNYSAEYPTEVNGDPDTKNANKFDISDAVDAQGKAVRLDGADFIKVYTATNQNAGMIGEISTEVCGAISLSVKTSGK